MGNGIDQCICILTLHSSGLLWPRFFHVVCQKVGEVPTGLCSREEPPSGSSVFIPSHAALAPRSLHPCRLVRPT